MKMIEKGIFVFLLWLGTVGLGYGQVSTEMIFPDTTQGFIAITNVETLQAQWQKTTSYEILHQKGFDSLRKAIQEQMEKNWTNRFGLKLSDVFSLPSGEIGVGLIAYPGRRPGYAMVMDIANKTEAVNQFLSTIIRETTAARNGEAKKDRLIIGNQAIDATVLTIPPDAQYSQTRTVYYVQLPSILIVTDQRYLAELLIFRLAGQGTRSLADTPTYQMIMKRCASDRAEQTLPQIKFFINPLEAGEAVRSISDLPEQERSKVSTYSILAKQGFDGVKGVGGIYDFATEGFESVWRVMAYIPEPPSQALKMLSFQNIRGFQPPVWINSDAIRSAYLNLDNVVAFDHIGPLFDQFLETEGAWKDILVSLEKDENGPQVNLREDLVAQLDTNISYMTTFEKPLSDTSARFVAAIPVKPGSDARVAQVLHRMFDTDPDFVTSAFNSDTIWTYVPKKRTPRERGNSPRVRRSRENTSEVANNADDGTLIKGTSFCVSSGCLFIGNDANYLRTMITDALQGKINVISNNPQSQKVLALIDKDTANTGRFLQGYTYNKDGFELNYNLSRQGQLPKSQTILARLLRSMIPKDRNEKSPLFDGASLPPFEDFKDKIGPGGYWGRVESNGWFFKGFTIPAE